jgi:hypothetical protein
MAATVGNVMDDVSCKCSIHELGSILSSDDPDSRFHLYAVSPNKCEFRCDSPIPQNDSHNPEVEKLDTGF